MLRLLRYGVLLILVAASMLFVVERIGWFSLPKFITHTKATTVVSSSGPVVMRHPGGRLEISTLTVYEHFVKMDNKKLWDLLDLGTTVSTIRAKVVYRYHIEMDKEWPITIEGTNAIVHAGKIKPSLPVAFDTTTVEKYTSGGWLRFNKRENLEALEREITPQLQERAGSPANIQSATDVGRTTVAEFVTKWLLKERAWKRDPVHMVMVLFPGETRQSVIKGH